MKFQNASCNLTQILITRVKLGIYSIWKPCWILMSIRQNNNWTPMFTCEDLPWIFVTNRVVEGVTVNDIWPPLQICRENQNTIMYNLHHKRRLLVDYPKNKNYGGTRLYIGVLHRIFFAGVSCALMCYTELRTDFRSRTLYVGVLVKT